jgi:hypothetical protein
MNLTSVTIDTSQLPTPTPTVVAPIVTTIPTTTTNNTTFYPSSNTSTTTNTNPPTTNPPTTNPQTTITPNNTSSSTSIFGNMSYNCSTNTPYFNMSTTKCEACPNSTEYVNVTNQCLPIIYMTNLAKATNLIQPSANYTSSQNNLIVAQHPTRVVQKCPDSTPYLSVFSGIGVCVGCNSSMYFAVATETCISGCPRGTIYNTDKQIC